MLYIIYNKYIIINHRIKCIIYMYSIYIPTQIGLGLYTHTHTQRIQFVSVSSCCVTKKHIISVAYNNTHLFLMCHGCWCSPTPCVSFCGSTWRVSSCLGHFLPTAVAEAREASSAAGVYFKPLLLVLHPLTSLW